MPALFGVECMSWTYQRAYSLLRTVLNNIQRLQTASSRDEKDKLVTDMLIDASCAMSIIQVLAPRSKRTKSICDSLIQFRSRLESGMADFNAMVSYVTDAMLKILEVMV